MVEKPSSFRLKPVLIALSLFSFLCAGPVWAHDSVMATAPHVPPPTERSESKTVKLHFEAKEFVGELAQGLGKGITYKFWSYNGTVPGPMARVRVGDTVEFHLTNPKANSQDHNIDMHAVNGPGGGAAVITVAPGESRVFSYKALAPGLFIYHCAAGQIVDHIANGMYGLILVEPEGGLPPVDREYYVMRSEFFTTQKKEGLVEFDIQRGLDENPTYVVFNGKEGGVMFENALTAKVGETVRIYYGNIGPNRVSSFHIIGEIFDKVYMEGAIGGLVNTNVQTTMIPSAGATIVEFKVDVPGTYALVDHSIFRVAKGAIGHLEVEGPEDPSIFKAGK
ncbi:copper-containing nitrite reductase [Nitrospina watsonii]|uniref:Copper-containing nitrite reductase n=1 Tax=Nitrospina watsonii TaxID=1323948 RepID=A0ABN8VYN1_9BACT|nr:copper-containing nitrite reductase [Nitrospina watsonii]CAI2717268.1 copper-containing nitrite reductase [Nitrospina watsonii]